MTALPLTNKITQTSAKSVNFTTITAQFGDGYMQRAIDGINDKKEAWNIQYDNLDQTDRDLVWVFIDFVKSTNVIEWQAPGDLTEKKWIIDPEGSVAEQAKSAAIYTIAFTLITVFDL